jgi:transposase
VDLPKTEPVMVEIETGRGLVVTALVAAGYQGFAVNPLASSRYRDRHGSSGAKPDREDAKVLADPVRTGRHNHRQIAGDSDLAEAVRVLARAHQSAILLTAAAGQLVQGAAEPAASGR